MTIHRHDDQPGYLAGRLFASLSPLEHDCIRLVDGCLTRTFGNGSGELCATVVVHRSRFYRRVLLGGGLGAAESWIDGDWTCDDLTTLVRIFIRNRQMIKRLNSRRTWLSSMMAGLRHVLRRNTRRGARRNIHEHYDLGNDFFALWLDETMMYSCAVFEREDMSLHQAQVARLERICRKLDLRPGDRVVEIGTGWGGFAIHAASSPSSRGPG